MAFRPARKYPNSISKMDQNCFVVWIAYKIENISAYNMLHQYWLTLSTYAIERVICRNSRVCRLNSALGDDMRWGEMRWDEMMLCWVVWLFANWAMFTVQGLSIRFRLTVNDAHINSLWRMHRHRSIARIFQFLFDFIFFRYFYCFRLSLILNMVFLMYIFFFVNIISV